MEITGSGTVNYLSPIYILIFFILVGFVYHLIRNKEYKNTLIASIIIRIILGLLINSVNNWISLLKWILIVIGLVIIGGFLAVAVKKLMNKDTAEFNPQKPSKSYRKWWDKQTPKGQAIMVICVCLFGLILIIGTISILNPAKDPVQLSINLLSSENKWGGVPQNNEDGTVLVISNDTREFILKGSSEPNATIRITASDLSIYNQTLQLDPDGNFAYNLSIPQNVTLIKIIVEATKLGKENSIVTLTLKR